MNEKQLPVVFIEQRGIISGMQNHGSPAKSAHSDWMQKKTIRMHELGEECNHYVALTPSPPVYVIVYVSCICVVYKLF